MTRARQLVLTIAPVWMVGGAIASAVAGVLAYLVLGMGFHAIRRSVTGDVEIILYVPYVLVPLFIALLVLVRLSVTLLSEDGLQRPGLAQHLWHCAFLYPFVLWAAYVIVDCQGAPASLPVRARCADSMGGWMALALSSLGGIVANAWVIWRHRRPLASTS